MIETVEFGRLFSEPLRNGVSYSSSLRGTGVPMINMKEIFAHDRIGNVDCELAPLTERERKNYVLEDFDLLFARQSLTYEGAGKCSLILPTEYDRTWESHLIRVRLNFEIACPEYFYYYFRSPQGRRNIETIVQQVAAAGIRGSDLARLQVPNPPIAQQRAIAEVLGALDDKISANSKLADIAFQLAGNIFDQATAALPTTPMSTVLTPVLGGTPSRANAEFWNGDDLWASAKDITGAPFAVVSRTVEKITQQAVERTKAKPLPAGSVILTARGTVGAVARLAVPASFNQSCYGFIPGEVAPGILYFSIVRASQQAKSMAHGSVFDTITMRTFDHLHIPDFRGDTSGVEAQITPLLDIVTAAVQENEFLAGVRDALLPDLMSGKLRVKDTEKVVEAAV